MQQFSGIDYLRIDVANQFGLDKLVWNDRIHWVNNNRPDLRALAPNGEYPAMMAKGILALEAAERGEDINHMVGLDATASGVQIMASMSGCKRSARMVNLINTGNREDLYLHVAQEMTGVSDTEFTKSMVKKPTMTFFYGSEAQPRDAFGEGTPAYNSFMHTMQHKLKGPYKLMQLFQSLWNPLADEYVWAMPDGHVVRVPVIQMEDKGLEIDEANHFRYTMRTAVQKPINKGRALAANIVHSVDGWICREMVRMSEEQGFYLITIHDCFFAHPNFMNQVREMYRDLLIRINKMNMVSMICSQIAGKDIPFRQLSDDLHEDIAESEYTLS